MSFKNFSIAYILKGKNPQTTEEDKFENGCPSKKNHQVLRLTSKELVSENDKGWWLFVSNLHLIISI